MGEVIRFLFGSVTAFSFEQTVVCSVHFLKRTCVHITGLFFYISTTHPLGHQSLFCGCLSTVLNTGRPRVHCRISPPRFLAECCKRQLNHGSFLLLYFRLFTFSDLYWVCLSIFFCTVLFVSISQVIGCEDCLWNDLWYCFEWGVKLYSNSS